MTTQSKPLLRAPGYTINDAGAEVPYKFSPYQTFRGIAAPTSSQDVDSLTGRLLGGYKQYQPKGIQDYVPPDVLSNVGQSQSRLLNYTPEKVTMPAEYYQKQVDLLTQPITQQYDVARDKARGDQAARGVLYDSQGYKDIGELDKNFLQELGRITSGVQQGRMEQEFKEGIGRRELGLDALKSAGSLSSDVFGKYGTLGGDESARVLQGLGLDANTINTLLGARTDQYGTEAKLFGDVYGTDVGDITTRETDRRKAIIDLLGLPGYTEQPQGPAYTDFLRELGFNYGDNPAGPTEVYAQGTRVK